MNIDSDAEPWVAAELPILLRIAGLPAEALDAFSAPTLLRHLHHQGQIQQHLERARANLVDSLFSAIPTAEPPKRRFLLKIKRACYNGRALTPWSSSPDWAELTRITPRLASRILRLEARLERSRKIFEERFHEQLTTEAAALRDLLQPGFLRGLSLASPLVAKNLHRLHNPQRGRREKRLEISLLRYISRAAAKLSPFSTLTRVGLGRLSPGSGPALDLAPPPWVERSVCRFKRYVLDQNFALLTSHPIFRSRLLVSVNGSVEEVSPGRYRYVRPPRWIERDDHLDYVAPSLATLDQDPSLVEFIHRDLEEGGRTLGELVAGLTEQASRPLAMKVEASINRLVEAGFLCLHPHWPSNILRPDAQLAEWLRPVPPATPLVEQLAGGIALQASYADAPSSVERLGELEASIANTWSSARAVIGKPTTLRRRRMSEENIFEDVFLSTAPPDGPEIAHIADGTVRTITATLAPWIRIAPLFDFQHDFLLTLGDFIGRLPSSGSMSALEVFSEFRPHWESHRRLLDRCSHSLDAPYNPFDLPEIDELHRQRTSLWQTLDTLKTFDKQGNEELAPEALTDLLGRLPTSNVPKGRACLFLQPATESGDLWVLNRLYEGNHRYASRFTGIMGEAQASFRDQLVARSVFEHRGEQIALLDLMHSYGDNLNVHPAQTEHVLVFPGESLGDESQTRQITLSELRITNDEVGRPTLRLPSGRRLLPVHLGGAGDRYLPSLLHFLACLGAQSLRNPLPPEGYLKTENGRIRRRLTLGNVILYRRSWHLRAADLATACQAPDEAQAFAAIQRWRVAAGVPRLAYLVERVGPSSDHEVYKPQFLDFSSPGFVRILRQALRSNPEAVTFEEALPEPTAFPKDAAGTRWATEIQLEVDGREP